MSNTLILGKAKELEIAGELTKAGLLVYYPFIDTGADLVVCASDMTSFLPIQVKYRKKNPSLGLEKSYLERLYKTNLTLAFIIGSGSNTGTWYIPIKEFKKKAIDLDRKDNLVYINITKNRKWLEKYNNEKGIELIKETLFR